MYTVVPCIHFPCWVNVEMVFWPTWTLHQVFLKCRLQGQINWVDIVVHAHGCMRCKRQWCLLWGKWSQRIGVDTVYVWSCMRETLELSRGVNGCVVFIRTFHSFLLICCYSVGACWVPAEWTLGIRNTPYMKVWGRRSRFGWYLVQGIPGYPIGLYPSRLRLPLFTCCFHSLPQVANFDQKSITLLALRQKVMSRQ